jgi:hypothetical protein
LIHPFLKKKTITTVTTMICPMIMAALAKDDNPAEPPPLPLPSKPGAAAALLEESTSYVGRVGLGGRRKVSSAYNRPFYT